MMVAETLVLPCPRCQQGLPQEDLQPGGVRCPSCQAHVEATVFPALFRREHQAADQTAISSEATCFFHADRIAVVPCSRCGRFLCHFCRISWAGEDLCPACLQTAGTGKEATKLASNRFHFDSIALVLSTLPLITVFFTFLTAPLALGITLFTFRKECSIVPRSKVRFILAILFSLAQIAAWIFFVVYSVRKGMGLRVQ